MSLTWEEENKLREAEELRKIKRIITGIMAGIVGLTLLIAVFGSFTTIDAGQVGVVKRFGEVTGRVMSPGFNLKTPFVEGVVRYNTKKLTYETTSEEKQKGSDADYKDYPVDTNTSDGQQVNVYYTVRFSVDPTKANWVAQNIGDEEALVEKIVKTESRVVMRNIPREFEASQIYTGSIQEVQKRAFDALNTVFSDNGLVLDSVGIREIKFSQEYISAIEAKQIEAVRVETEKNRAESAKFEKERKITQAEATAEEQRLLRETLSAEVLQNKFYEKWDGKLPNVITGDSDLLLNIGQ